MRLPMGPWTARAFSIGVVSFALMGSARAGESPVDLSRNEASSATSVVQRDVVRDRNGRERDLPTVPGDPLDPQSPQSSEILMRHRVEATNARRNRRLMGPARRFVQGVPAEPVDSFCWNGVGSTPIEGSLVIDVQPMTNTGSIRAEWKDEHGTWTYRQVRFYHPDHHPSGVRIGASINDTDSILNEGISQNVYLHGDTASGMPVLPTVFTYLAAWGPAEVTLNGEQFRSPFEIPAPLWQGHVMVTEGVRRPDGTVRTVNNEIFDPSKSREGAVEPGDIEVHLTFHDDLFPNTGNVPPPFSFFYHLVFEDVSIQVLQGDPAPPRPVGVELVPN